MIGGLKTASGRRIREEGEKPFWISFSDLMSALMVLFLVAMSVALLAVTSEASTTEKLEAERSQAIADFMREIEQILTAKEFEGVKVIGNTIDFGPRGRFEREGQNQLSAAQKQLLLQFTPKLLDQLRSSEAGKHWFKRAVVEGYASRSGKYLFNLNLSLERSERVICDLLRDPGNGMLPLSLDDRMLIATQFFVGGGSFNSLQPTALESRRIEFKLEFKTRKERDGELTSLPVKIDQAALIQALDTKEPCPIVNR